MCYIIITGRGLLWFLLSLIAAMAIAVAIVTPKWLIGPEPIKIQSSYTVIRYPSVGIYTRCKETQHHGFHCGSFDTDGFSTDSLIYPMAWKATMVFITLGFLIQSLTVILVLITYCRQSIFGKSIHTVTGSAQILAGIFVLISVFLHPAGWDSDRVKKLCSSDTEAYYPADCSIGWAMYTAIAAILLCFICGGVSIKAETGNMKSYVKRRIEGGDRFVCVL